MTNTLPVIVEGQKIQIEHEGQMSTNYIIKRFIVFHTKTMKMAKALRCQSSKMQMLLSVSQPWTL